MNFSISSIPLNVLSIFKLIYYLIPLQMAWIALIWVLITVIFRVSYSSKIKTMPESLMEWKTVRAFWSCILNWLCVLDLQCPPKLSRVWQLIRSWGHYTCQWFHLLLNSVATGGVRSRDQLQLGNCRLTLMGAFLSPPFPSLCF